MVSSDNNNKYYDMIQDSETSFYVNYGRVGVNPQKKKYHISQWYRLYNSKIKKGYVDITPNLKLKSKLVEVENPDINELFNVLNNSSKNQINSNYLNIADGITSLQLEKANQYLLDAYYYYNKSDILSINSALLQLYTVIPRKMTNVKNYLLNNINDFYDRYNFESDLLSNLKVQSDLLDTNIKDYLDIKIELCNDEDYKIINDLIRKDNSCNKRNLTIKKAFKISNNVTESKFNSYINSCKNKSIQLVWHGSRTENWLSILKNGLKIKPAGVYHSGSAYGNGIYGSTCFDKSYNYTSGNHIFLSIQKFHVGSQFIYEGWYNGNSFPLTYEELRKRDYDSTFVRPGGKLLNNEYIIYKEDQTTINYLTWF